MELVTNFYPLLIWSQNEENDNISGLNSRSGQCITLDMYFSENFQCKIN